MPNKDFGKFGHGHAGFDGDGQVVGLIIDQPVEFFQRQSNTRLGWERAVIEPSAAADGIYRRFICKSRPNRLGHVGLVGRCDSFGQG